MLEFSVFLAPECWPNAKCQDCAHRTYSASFYSAVAKRQSPRLSCLNCIMAKLCSKGFMAITLTIDGRNHQLKIEVGSSSHSFYKVFYIPGPNGGFLAGLMNPSVFLRNLGTIVSKNLQEFGSEG